MEAFLESNELKDCKPQVMHCGEGHGFYRGGGMETLPLPILALCKRQQRLQSGLQLTHWQAFKRPAA
jgi:hypothetical protein